jgi:ferredoxin-NADP reductase
VPAEFWNLTTTYPGMLLAVAGTAALCMTVVTSVKAARRRLRYESWHLLHLYAYLGVGLALPHQLWTGQEFLASPGATAFWWTAWAVSAVAVLWWRVAVPLARSTRHRLHVTSVRLEGDGVVSVFLAGRDLDRLRAEAGQFLTLRFLNRAGWTRGNPYSLSAAPDGRSLRITVKEVGDNSGAMRALEPGTRALVEGPYGRLSSRARTRRKVALLGAGVGITPLRALAEGLDYARGDAVLIQRFDKQPLFDHELRVLAEERGLELVRLPGSRRSPDSWLGGGFERLDDAQALRSLVPDLVERDVFLCGPEAWIESVRRAATAVGIAPSQVHVERFGW